MDESMSALQLSIKLAKTSSARATQHNLHLPQAKAVGDGDEDYVRLCNICDGIYGGARGEERHARKKDATEHGVSTACVLRMAEDASDEGMTLLGDAWSGSFKVREA
jgi:hypothetical protein